jgi:hypothetical protein
MLGVLLVLNTEKSSYNDLEVLPLIPEAKSMIL